MNLLDTSPALIRAKQTQPVPMHAQQLVDFYNQHGIVVTAALNQAREDALRALGN